MKKKIIIVLLAIVAAIVVIFGAHAIYYKVLIANAPTMQELAEAYPWKVPSDWFQTDTITLKGRIEGYDAESRRDHRRHGAQRLIRAVRMRLFGRQQQGRGAMASQLGRTCE